MNQEQKDLVKNTINSNKIFVMLKGTPEQPRCGFSNRVVQVLNHFDVEYSSLNVFDNVELMNLIKEYSNWPTTPQLYVNGELIGGCDIVEELAQNGELKNILDKAK
ncbi:MAG: monothiol glutaredoxin, Grx4 family [Candidatus Marinimicrobia bacterium]|nr:monothiol glutaredoxin, Grx4 family [Candidatus Neomarinimicrobiota bacterium]|tara:strand:+ start:1945 stop:2262 length:318 start_codon:yes stop_codon:yes gene_type:complete